MRRIALALFVATLVACAAYIVDTSSELPARVASHFGAGGGANGWMPHDAYLLFMLGLCVLMPGAVVLILTLVPRAIPKRANIPNREYWLSESRRDQTRVTLTSFGCVLGSLLSLFIAGVHFILIRANEVSPAHLPGPLFVATLVAFLAALALWVVALQVRFRAPR